MFRCRAFLLLVGVFVIPACGGGSSGGGGGAAPPSNPTWTLSSTIPVGISLIQGVATDGTLLYVTGTLDPTIFIFDLNGVPQGTLTLNTGFGVNLSALAIDKTGNGNLWVADTATETLYELDPISGVIQNSISIFGWATGVGGLDVVAGATIFLTDTADGEVLIVDIASSLITGFVISSETPRPTGLTWEATNGTVHDFNILDSQSSLFYAKEVTLDTSWLLTPTSQEIVLSGITVISPKGLDKLDATTYLLADQFTGNVLVFTKL